MDDFAKFIGVSQSWLSNYYYGKVIYPSGRVAAQIVKKLDHKITIQELMSMRGRGKKFNKFA